MTAVLFIRHGPTDWNRRGLIQGHTDIPLADDAREAVLGWRLPGAVAAGFDWVSSPLRRARDTAALLGAPGCPTDPRLMEAHWGAWEGRNLRELRQELGEALRRNEARGLDLTPPGGESPRQVRERLESWLAEIAVARRPVVAVTHNGVLRAAYSSATGWDMTRDGPLRRGHAIGHLYGLDGTGRLSVRALNILLAPEPKEAPDG